MRKDGMRVEGWGGKGVE